MAANSTDHQMQSNVNSNSQVSKEFGKEDSFDSDIERDGERNISIVHYGDGDSISVLSQDITDIINQAFSDDRIDLSWEEIERATAESVADQAAQDIPDTPNSPETSDISTSPGILAHTHIPIFQDTPYIKKMNRTTVRVSVSNEERNETTQLDANAANNIARLMGAMTDANHAPVYPLGKPLYPIRTYQYCECAVCCETVPMYKRYCCAGRVCDECMLRYIESQVKDAGHVKMACPVTECQQYLQRDEITARLGNSDIKEIYLRLYNDANREINEKTCPNCSTLTKVEMSLVKKPDKKGILTRCQDCNLEWCFVCQAPWHTDISCKTFHRREKALKRRAKKRKSGLDRPNAQKCPGCKTLIKKTSGCDMKTCEQCGVEFCYRCGDRCRNSHIFGGHKDKLSILGCKDKLYPEKPHLRRFSRGSLFVAGLSLASVVAIGAGAVITVPGVVLLPVVGGVKLYRHLKKKH